MAASCKHPRSVISSMWAVSTKPDSRRNWRDSIDPSEIVRRKAVVIVARRSSSEYEESWPTNAAADERLLDVMLAIKSDSRFVKVVWEPLGTQDSPTASRAPINSSPLIHASNSRRLDAALSESAAITSRLKTGWTGDSAPNPTLNLTFDLSW